MCAAVSLLDLSMALPFITVNEMRGGASPNRLKINHFLLIKIQGEDQGYLEILQTCRIDSIVITI